MSRPILLGLGNIDVDQPANIEVMQRNYIDGESYANFAIKSSVNCTLEVPLAAVAAIRAIATKGGPPIANRRFPIAN